MTATTARELAGKIAEAVAGVEGLRPATVVASDLNWLPIDLSGGAVDLTPELVEVRLLATRLPLPPLLERAGTVVRDLLAGTEWERARLRLVVTDIDGAAFD
ncbi:hypothetical protein [Amycolatopsis jiangsuensis]|uniref:Asp23/Gls24 family envelope stress response protein n=1 Tax=Amycolatopsis jiangsuensis TaxID=1181879 RepID=A0A840J037_9PSEU|nr:hypothetical protein [Amycolatopsis jiangsuensis]MBB4687440.1 hypothetical protein [Amycolatopsis jiangsuensis]